MMKLFWHTFFLFTMALSGLQAQSETQYTIQAGTFIDAKPSDFDALRTIGFVYANELGDNLIEVYVGGYDDRNLAQQRLSTVQQSGYPNAFIKERGMNAGRPATIIQIATRQTNQPIEWEQLMEAGPLYGTLSNDLIKVVTGPYTNAEAAQADLNRIRQMGYSDAFVKSVNEAALITLGAYETGVKAPLIPLEMEGRTTANTPPESYSQTGERTPPSQQLPRNNTPQAYDVLTPRAPSAPTVPRAPTEPQPPASVPDIPSSYDYYNGDVRPNTTGDASAADIMPAIDGSVKRGSVLGLQKILKAAKAYTGSLDGYYGPGTTKGYETYVAQNRTLQQYSVLAETQPLPGKEGSSTGLQKVINNLDDPANATALDNYRTDPLAKAYQAYQLFRNFGPGQEVNQLMNTAITGAFKGKPLAGLPFDPSSTYAYQDIGQLILHLHYIHAAPATEEAAPCWMMYRHPSETTKAYEIMASMVGDELNLQGCGQFESWSEVRLLVTIAADLNGEASFDQKRLSQAATERSRLYMAPKPLNTQEKTAVEKWDKNLMSGISGWAARDPMHERLAESFKAMYLQTQVRLEDYFMDKGYDRKEATALALATLHTLVAYHMERFV
jgi:hypothetical protein